MSLGFTISHLVTFVRFTKRFFKVLSLRSISLLLPESICGESCGGSGCWFVSGNLAHQIENKFGGGSDQTFHHSVICSGNAINLACQCRECFRQNSPYQCFYAGGEPGGRGKRERSHLAGRGP